MTGLEPAFTKATELSKGSGVRYRVELLNIGGRYLKDRRGTPYFKVFSY